MNISDTLLPCPFCGCLPIIERERDNGNWRQTWRASCENCGASPGFKASCEQAAEQWNTRSDLSRNSPSGSEGVE